MSLAQALSLVRTSYPCVDINSGFLATLKKLDRCLGPPLSPPVAQDTTTTTVTNAATTQSNIRTAWT